MMDNEIIQSLSSLGVDFAYEEYTGESDTYIVYSEYDGRPEAYADNQEILEAFYYQFDIFTKSDYSALLKSLKQSLFLLGGTRQNEFSHFESGVHQRSIRFKFIRETE